MRIDIAQVQSAGQRIGRIGADARSYATSADGTLRSALGSNKGFSAIEALGQVLDALGKQVGDAVSDNETVARDIGTAADNHARTENGSKSSMESLRKQLTGATKTPAGKTTANPMHDVLGTGATKTPAPGSHEEFIETAGKAAQDSQKRFGVPASVSSAQAIVESGWGKSGLSKEANNYFGIKCSGGDAGPNATSCVNYKTWEVVNGNDTSVRDAFRSYDSASDSFLDHGQFLKDNPRYTEAFKYTDNPDQFAREIQKAGYATDPHYADKLIGMMHKY
ncbi:MAG TPA: glucosaminidase domain-containing protein, partial [Stackebrandtia sp.]|uniref:glucosaminidase domain-containing protein n=1 Tax=Stackebrandtia sp. TaxID=2023065 RepID=UPI002D5A5287